MPHLWALMRRAFNLKAFLNHTSTFRSRLRTNSGPEALSRAAQSPITNNRKWHGFKGKGSEPDSFLDCSESEEQITGIRLKIRKDLEFRVERDSEGRDLSPQPGICQSR